MKGKKKIYTGKLKILIKMIISLALTLLSNIKK